MDIRPALPLEQIIEQAEDASASAGAAVLDPEDKSDCGSAVLVVPARYRRLVRFLKERGIHWQRAPEGYWFSVCPGFNRYQSRRPIERACDAYAEVLQSHGFERVHGHSWAD